MSSLVSRRGRAIAAAAPLLALMASPVIPLAAADKPTGSTGGKTVTCQGAGGGTPGQTVTQTNTTMYKGHPVGTTTTTLICGSDGVWHAKA